MLPAIVQDITIDDGVLDSFGLRYEPASAAGKIVPDFGAFRRVDPFEVEDREVGGKPSAQLPAIA
ncbi:MAG TPA: hypothetical protein VKR29_11315, partial [Candidatus Binataceae bacterium]|nr:hypothetical protein [Candidatus Binataceae bacterium]